MPGCCSSTPFDCKEYLTQSKGYFTLEARFSAGERWTRKNREKNEQRSIGANERIRPQYNLIINLLCIYPFPPLPAAIHTGGLKGGWGVCYSPRRIGDGRLPVGSGAVSMNSSEQRLCDAREIDGLIATMCAETQ